MAPVIQAMDSKFSINLRGVLRDDALRLRELSLVQREFATHFIVVRL
jgi:hypothetical protein